MKTALRVIAYLVSVPLIIYGALLLATALLGQFLGGPREPPSGMTWQEFKTWTDSGRWFWESLFQGLGFVAIPLLVLWGVNRLKKY